jgi:raffinose/stachyose/melibiose transport system permease protein
MLTAFMETIPRELEEAAIMDGASMWRVFRNIVFPLSQPALVTLATFQVLYSWNEFILALMLTKSASNRTMPVGMAMLIGEFFTNFPVLFAAFVIAIIPGIVFFLLLQRYVVAGMSAGALKGI